MEILNTKYYINESTKYFYVKNIVDNYINYGSCNYFENINTNTTEKDNINYLYNFIINSIKNNLNDKYFTKKEENNNYIVILKIDNDNLKDILSNILKDLKEDKKSRKILDNINKNILNTKIKEEDIYLEKEEYYKMLANKIPTMEDTIAYYKLEEEANANNLACVDIDEFIRLNKLVAKDYPNLETDLKIEATYKEYKGDKNNE